MSKETDQRVVEMRFDNKQFEQGAKKTLSTLKDLKVALDSSNSTKGLEAIDTLSKNIRLDGIASGIEELQKRFSTFGIVGMQVVANITDSLMGLATKGIKTVTDNIVSGGVRRAMNIENAHFQLQALLKDETKVQAIMGDAMESVDGTAYAYDEAAKAASQFAASGLEAGEEMLSALKGITGVAAMTNSEYEGISNIFTTVAGNGRLMGDQLLQLSARGLNAASTLADYFKEVRGQSNMTEAQVRDMVTKGQLDFKTFADAMGWAFGDSAKRANETFTGAMANMKSALARIGADFVSPLIEQNGGLVKLFNALRIKINEFKSALSFDEKESAISGLAESSGMAEKKVKKLFDTVDKSGNVTSKQMEKLSKNGIDGIKAVEDYLKAVKRGQIHVDSATLKSLNSLSKGTKISRKLVKQLVNEGKIDAQTFTSAIETSFGNQRSISQEFANSFLYAVKKVRKAVKTFDVNTPVEILYNGLDSVVNVLKGIASIVRPIGSAFFETFHITGKDVVHLTENIKALTAQFKLSEKDSKNLHDAFKGIFDIVSVLGDGFIALVSAILPVNKPIGDTSSGILGLAGNLGRMLSELAEWLRVNPKIAKAYNVFSNNVQKVSKNLSKFVGELFEFLELVPELPITQKIVEGTVTAFSKFGDIANEKFFSNIAKAFKTLFKSINKAIKSGDIGIIADAILDFVVDVGGSGFEKTIDVVTEAVDKLRKAFTLENISDAIKNFKDNIGGFIDWFGEKVAPFFEDFTFGNLIAGGTSIGFILTFFKSLDVINDAVVALKKLNIGGVLGNINGVLLQYQNSIKANTLIKIGAAVALFAGAMLILSFIPEENLIKITTILIGIAATLLIASGLFLKATQKLDNVTYGVSNALTNISKSMQTKALGKMIKDIAISMLLIIGGIVIVAKAYETNSTNMDKAFDIVKKIGLAIAGFALLFTVISGFGNGRKAYGILGSMIGMSILLGTVISVMGKLFNMTFPTDVDEKMDLLDEILTGLAFLSVFLAGAARLGGSGDATALTILSLAGMLYVCIWSVNELLNMNFPKDFRKKFNRLEDIIKMLGGLVIAIGITNYISKGNSSNMTGTMLSLAGMLYVCVWALNELFNMNFPDDYKTKVNTLYGIIAAMAGLTLFIGIAAKVAGGAIKAGGTIIALCAFLIVVVGALSVLTSIAVDREVPFLVSALAIMVILIGLGAAMAGISKSAGKGGTATVLTMVLALLSVVFSLAALTNLDLKDLIGTAATLGILFGFIAVAFNWMGDATKKLVDPKGLLIMIGALSIVAFSLYEISKHPIDRMIVAALSMIGVMTALVMIMQYLGKMRGLNVATIGLFILATMSLALIASSLRSILDAKDTSKIADAALGLSAVLLALVVAFSVVGSTPFNIANLLAFAGVSAVLLLGLTELLKVIGKNDWDSLLPAAVSISAILLALSAAFLIMGINPLNISGIFGFIAAAIAIVPIADALRKLTGLSWDEVASGLIMLAGALAIIGVATILFGPVAPMMILLGVAVAVFSAAINVLGPAIVTFLECLLVAEPLFEEFLGTLGGLAEAFVQAGVDIIAGLVEGIKSAFDDAVQAIVDVCYGIYVGFTDFFDEHSPSRVMMELGRYLMEGLKIGIESAGKWVVDGVGGVSKSIKSTVSDMVDSANEMAKTEVKAPAYGEAAQELHKDVDELSKEVDRIVELDEHIKQIQEHTKDNPYFQNIKMETEIKAEEKAELDKKLEKANKERNKQLRDISRKSSDYQFELGEQRKEFVKAQKQQEVELEVTPTVDERKTEETAKNTANYVQDLLSQYAGDADITELTDKLGIDLGENIDIDGSLSEIGEKLGIDLSNGFDEGFNLEGELQNKFDVKSLLNNYMGGSNDAELSGEEFIAQFETGAVNKANDAALNIAVLLKRLIKEAIINADFTTVGRKVVNRFSKQFTTGEDIIQSNVEQMINSAVTIMKKTNERIKEAGEDAITKWTDGVETKYDDAMNVGSRLARTLKNAMIDLAEEFRDLGLMHSYFYIDGLKTHEASAERAGDDMAMYALQGISHAIHLTEQVAQDTVSQFIKTISSSSNDLQSSGESMGLSVWRGTNDSFRKNDLSIIGGKAASKFIGVLMSYVSQAYEAGKEIGEATSSGIAQSLGQSYGTIQNIAQPTIRPVVDLSNVERAVVDVNKMFGNSMTSTGLLSATVASALAINQKQNDNVVKAINDLKREMVNIPRNTYTIGTVKYEEGSDVAEAMESLAKAMKMKGRA